MKWHWTSYGDSKAGRLHTAPFGENARDWQNELRPVWKVNQIEAEEATICAWGKWPRGRWPQCSSRPQGIQTWWKIQQKTSSTAWHLLQMWERETPKGTGLQGCGHYLQRVWKERTLWKGLPEGKTLCTLSGDPTGQFCRGWWTPIFQWLGTTSLHLHGQCPHVNKHLIKFPVALEPTTLKGNNADSPQSLCCSRQTQGQPSIWWTEKLSINSLEQPKKCLNQHLSRWKIMEILQWKC